MEDRVVLGSEEAKYSFGFNFGAKYKGFDALLLFQGAAGVHRYVNGEVVGEINGDDTHPTDFWNDRWRPDHTDTDVPRVSVSAGGASMPVRISDYWYQNASYVRLKNVQVGLLEHRKEYHDIQVRRSIAYHCRSKNRAEPDHDELYDAMNPGY